MRHRHPHEGATPVLRVEGAPTTTDALSTVHTHTPPDHALSLCVCVLSLHILYINYLASTGTARPPHWVHLA